MRKYMAFTLCLMLFCISCSSIIVSQDYDPQVDFSTMKTFKWMDPPEKTGMNTLTIGRIQNAVNAQMKVKGFSQSSDTADFLIALHYGQEDKTKIRDWGYSYAHRGFAGHSGVDVYQYEEGKLILDFVNAKTKELFWRGVAKGPVSHQKTPEKREKEINKVITKILKKFPPE